MKIYQLGSTFEFPHPGKAPAEGLLAFGGDLDPYRLIVAYSQGIFPWYSDDSPILWWSPDPRMVMKPEEFTTSKSLNQLIRKIIYSVTFDQECERVMRSCATVVRPDEAGTWISEELIQAFIQLHLMGLAHSVEVWYEGKLVGGLYGLALGKIFFGESMFYHLRDASKFALFHLCRFLHQHEFILIDAQQDTPHLRSLGARTMDRADFLQILEQQKDQNSLIGNWGDGSAKFCTFDFYNPFK
jgi:leucyl/phenylalanyl-tRNA--protein transferase